MNAPGTSGHSSSNRSSISPPPLALPLPEDNRVNMIQESGRLEFPQPNPVSASAQSLSIRLIACLAFEEELTVPLKYLSLFITP